MPTLSPTQRPRFLRFSSTQHILLCKRLALYLRSGIPIARAITFIAEDSTSPSTRYVLMSIVETITSGLPLSRALAAFPRQFDSYTIGFIRSGEVSGALAETLEQLANTVSKRVALRRKILSALAYPGLILCGTVSVALFLTLFIFPKIVPVLKGFRTTLPLSTRILIGIDTACTTYWYVGIFVLSVLIVGIFCSIRSQKMRRVLERSLLHLPLFSKLYQYYAVATFARTLAVQLKGGVRILPSLALAQTALPGVLYAEALAAVGTHINEGQRFSVALRSHHTLFPPIVCQMVAAGEATGTLSTNLVTIAELFEESLDELAKNLTVLVEPVLMILMGFVVGFVALAIITPIYQVTQNLHMS